MWEIAVREKPEGTFFRSGRKGGRRCCGSCMADQLFLRPRSEVCKRPGLRAPGARVRVYRKPFAALVLPVWTAHVLSVLRAMAPRLTPAEVDWISKQDRAGQSPMEIRVGCVRQWARRGVAAPAQGADRSCPHGMVSIVDGSRQPGVALGITGDHSARVAVRGGVGCVRRRAKG